MVAHPRTALGSGDLRLLNLPAAVAVVADAQGRPLAVRRRSWPAPRPVAEVQDRWRIDDEWWRERAISRLYQAVLLADGTLLVLYHDLIEGGWYEQRSAERG